MKRFLCVAISSFLLGLVGCTDSAPKSGAVKADAAQDAVLTESGSSFAVTTQTYDSDAGSYGDSQTKKSASREQIESAIRSLDWSPGPIRPLVKLVRMDAGDITAYLQIKRDQDAGDTILATWQSVADGNQFTRLATLGDMNAVLAVALAFSDGDNVDDTAEWTNQ
ncbi:MAG: hypothetical protein WBH28_19440 [Fuerstiella sp.]